MDKAQQYNYTNWNFNIPGNLTKNESLQQMLRVNHAGELAAVQIYKWQARVLSSLREELKTMQAQEKVHLSYFEYLLQARDLKKSKLTPLWKFSGAILGLGTALLGENAAKICTQAVEESIVEHYDRQLEILKLDADEKKITAEISKIRDEELEHSDEAEHFSEQKIGFREKILRKIIKTGCKIAINIAKKI